MTETVKKQTKIIGDLLDSSLVSLYYRIIGPVDDSVGKVIACAAKACIAEEQTLSTWIATEDYKQTVKKLQKRIHQQWKVYVMQIAGRIRGPNGNVCRSTLRDAICPNDIWPEGFPHPFMAFCRSIGLSLIDNRI